MLSKALDELKQEALDQEPSLDKMVDLTDPKVLKGLGAIAEEAYQRRKREEELSSKPFSREELMEAGIPENLHAIAGWWATLEDMKDDLNL